MPSLDVVSRINFAELDNAINNTKKAVQTRFDFRNSPVEITVDKKEKKLALTAQDEMKVKALREMLESSVIKRGIALKALSFGEPAQVGGGQFKIEAKLKEGLEQDLAKKIVKTIKDTKMKVQASIQGEEVRITGKQIDDLQAVMTLLDKAGLDQPLQYVNMKRD
ncbi:MAG: YajQ family cyclic di-GMP-binding protein [Phycisphaeraceae bacterium]|nr:YajQ family cyclic di-GMP-binding protein [Phycisphaeraceae bacterium]